MVFQFIALMILSPICVMVMGFFLFHIIEKIKE